MKTTIISLLLLFVSSSVLFSQNEDYKSTLSLSVGYSLADHNIIDKSETDNEFTVGYYPVIQAGYHYTINKRFSIGGLASTQFLVMNYSSYNGADVNFKKTLVINNYAIRGLVHYGIQYKVNMYSGLRVGITDYMIETDQDLDGDMLIRDTNASKIISVSSQLVLLGLQTKLSNHVGANLEICVGQPYFVSLGLTYSL